MVQVDFFSNGQFIGSVNNAPYLLEIGPSTLPFGPGLYAFHAVATDNSGDSTVSAPISVRLLDPSAPTIAILAPDPVDGPLLLDVETEFEIAVTGSNAPIASVELIINGVFAAQATVQNGLWYANYTPRSRDGFDARIRVTNTLGGVFDSLPVNYTTSQGSAPVVIMTGPPVDLQVGQATVISATATDADGFIVTVNAYVNGQFVGEAQPGQALGSFVFPYTPTQTGLFTFGMEAIDNQGNRTLAERTSTVTAGTAPVVTITQPDPIDSDADGIADSPLRINEPITFAATVTDDGIIETVTFRLNGLELTPVTVAAGVYSVPFTPAATGVYLLEVSATDNQDNTTIASIRYRVEAGASPIVNIVAPDPADGTLDGIADAELTVFSPYILTAEASDPDGNVVTLEYFVDGRSLGLGALNGTTGLYELEWVPEGIGIFHITALATDNMGNQAEAVVAYRVVPGTASEITWLTPNMTDADNDGIVDQPIFLFGSNDLRIRISDPEGMGSARIVVNNQDIIELTQQNFVGVYEGTWTPVLGGLHQLRLEVTDARGNLVTETYYVMVLSPPSLSILTPSPFDGNGDGIADVRLTSGDTVMVQFTATDLDGTVEEIEVFDNGQLLGRLSDGDLIAQGGNSYGIAWGPLTQGLRTLRVEATDNDGLSRSLSVSYFVLPRYPDLIVQQVVPDDFDDPLAVGDDFGLAITIANISQFIDVPVGARIDVELELDSGETLRIAPNFEGLPAGETIELSATVKIDSSLPNGLQRIIFVHVDPDGLIAEESVLNNTLGVNIPFTVESYADLVIETFELVNPGGLPFYPGGNFTVRMEIANTGDRASELTDYRLELLPPPFGTGITVTGAIPAIAPEGVIRIDRVVPIPLDNENGPFAAYLTIDASNLVDEGGEGELNNEQQIDLFTIDSKPDLRITEVAYEGGEWQGGDPIEMRITWENRRSVGGVGTVRVTNRAEELYYVSVYLSANPIVGDADDFLLFEVLVAGNGQGGNLVPGESVTADWIQALPENLIGDFFVVARIDRANNIDELVEQDLNDNGNNDWISLDAPRIRLSPSHNPVPTTTMVSQHFDDPMAALQSQHPDVSRDGRYIVYESLSRIDPADTNDWYDIYLHDTLTGETRWISRPRVDDGPGGDSRFPRISADGSVVVFESEARNLVFGDQNGHKDIFAYEVETGFIDRISLSSAGMEANGSSHSPDINEDGTLVTFISNARNLVSGVTGGLNQVYWHNLSDGTTALVSRGTAGTGANQHVTQARLSANGEFVAFVTSATNIVPGSSGQHVYRTTMAGQNPLLISQNTDFVRGNARSYSPAINADGTVIAFVSEADNLDLVVADTNNQPDVFVRDLSTLTTERLLTSTGREFNSPGNPDVGVFGALEPSISDDGNLITFKTLSNNLRPRTIVRSDGRIFTVSEPGTAGYDLANDVVIHGYSDLNAMHPFTTAFFSDIYLVDRREPSAIEMISLDRFGYASAYSFSVVGETAAQKSVGSNQNAVISGDGRYVVFVNDGRGSFGGLKHGRTNLTDADINDYRDVFIRDRRTSGGVVVGNPPIVSLEQPLNNSSVVLGQAVLIHADVDAQVPVDQLLFLVNGEIVDTLTNGNTFTIWTPPGAGLYRIQAVARDRNGFYGQSSRVTISVGASNAPVVQLPADLDGAVFPTGGVIDVPASVQVFSGTIAQVDFYLNGELLAERETAPYRVRIGEEILPNYAPGVYQMHAIAYTSTGQAGFSLPVTFTVTEPGAPVIGAFTPAADSLFALGVQRSVGARVTVGSYPIASVLASINGGIPQAMIETNEVGFYTFAWTPSLLGQYTIRITATDTRGTSTTRSVQYQVADTAGPVITRITPANGTTVSIGDAVEVRVLAEPGDAAIANASVVLNNADVISLGSPNADGEYVFIWAPDLAGLNSLRFVFVDALGKRVESTVEYEVTFGTAPTVRFLSPISNTRYLPGTQLPVQVLASDADGLVTSVTLLLNNVPIITLQQAPYRTFINLPSEGTYRLDAIAVDNDGNATQATPVFVETGSPDPDYPEVVMTHPLPLGDGDVVNDVSVPSDMFLNATVRATASPIVDVRFYINGHLLGSSTSQLGNTYARYFKPNAPGSYLLMAEAEDEDGRIVQSIPIALDVGPLQSPLPKVEIFQPFPTSLLGRNVNIFVEADAGLISVERVDFYANGVLIGSTVEEVADKLFTFNWQPDQAGTFTLQARAVQVDPGGNEWDNWVISNAVSVEIIDPGNESLPTISLVSPVDGAQQTVGNPIALQAEALDPLGSILEVRFYANGLLLEPVDSQFPYTISFVPTSPGQYQFVAELISDRGLRVQSDPVTVDVSASQLPTVIITSPESDAELPVGRSFMIAATATSTSGTNLQIDFFANGVFIGTSLSVPYRIHWTPQSTGNFVLRAEAREAGTGGVAVSDEVNVTIVGTAFPTARFVSPGDINPTAGSDVLVEVEAEDEDGFVAYVEFFVNGQSLGAPDTSSPFATFWRPQSAGTYELMAVVVDNSGNATQISRMITVGPQVGIVPRVNLSITASGNVTPGSRVMVRANVFDDTPDQVAVTFFMNGIQLAPTIMRPPYAIIVDPEIGFGNIYEITAVASDPDGNSRATVLGPLYISDVTVDQPNLEIISLRDGDNLTLGSRAPIRLRVAGGAVSDIATVVFYANGEEIGRDSTAPYAFDWIPDQLGAIEITAATLLNGRSYDHDGDPDTPPITVTPVNISSPVRVQVNEPVGQLPSVSLDVLPGNENLVIGSRILLYADAQDLDGEVESVSFFLNGELIGTDTVAPFTHVITTTREGTFALNAVATDDDGNVVTSSYVTFNTVSRVVTQTPTLALTVPSSGQEGSIISLRASAQGFVNSPSEVVFYVNGQAVGSSSQIPYELPWLANLNGQVTFFSTAQYAYPDGSVVSAVSNIVGANLTANVPPVIAGITVDFPNSNLPAKPNPLVGEPITFIVDATDTGPIQTVELLRNGAAVATSASTSTPYELVDTPPGLGNYQYSVVVTDAGGLQTQSAVIPISVVRGESPVVTVLEPRADESFIQNVPIRLSANATDADGSISEVVFLINGTQVGATLTAPPYAVTFTPPSAGNYSLTVRARDNSGNLTTSAAVPFFVIADLPPRFIEFGNNLAGSLARLNQPIVWTFEVEDDFGLASVTLYRNGTAVPSAAEVPVEVVDVPPGLGRYRYYAEAVDTAGNITRTETIEIETRRGLPPVVTIVEPLSTATIRISRPATMRATAVPRVETDGLAQGSVTKVDFYANGRLIGTTDLAPYLIVIPAGTLIEGQNSLVAVATMDTGLTASSGSLQVTGVEGSVPEVLLFRSSAVANESLVGSEIRFDVEAVDEEGLTRVELLLSGDIITVDANPPYRFVYTPDDVGVHVFTARAVNARGNSALSEEIAITIRQPDPIQRNEDFVLQTFHDLLLRAPLPAEQAEFTSRIDSGDLARDRLLFQLLDPQTGFGSTEYAHVRNAILAHQLLLDEWLDRDELLRSVAIIKDSGFPALVASLMPRFQDVYVEQVNQIVELALQVPITRVPDKLSPTSDRAAYVNFLFLRKFGVMANASQLQKGQLYFSTWDRDEFTANFIKDVVIYATSSSFITGELGFSFTGMAPDDTYLRRANAASLLINLLRVRPDSDEVAELADKLFVTQVGEVLLDPRYIARFLSAFEEDGLYPDGWRRSAWFGWYNKVYSHWSYHTELGWIALPAYGHHADNLWYYDTALGWVWTTADIFPLIYSDARSAWLYQHLDAFGRPDRRKIYNIGTRQWSDPASSN